MLAKLKLDGKPSVEVPEEFTSKYVPSLSVHLFVSDLAAIRPGTANRILEAKEKEREKGKGKERPSKRAKRYAYIPLISSPRNSLISIFIRNSDSESDSGSSSGSDDSNSSSGSDSDSSGSESQSSRDGDRKRRVPSKRRSERSRSVSSASDSEPRRGRS